MLASETHYFGADWSAVGLKFTPIWAKAHLNYESGKANPKIIKLLAVTPPLFEAVLKVMKDTAEVCSRFVSF